jgi:hypothetical protein
LININSPQKKLCAGLLTWKTIKTLEEIFKTDLNYLKSQGVINYQSEKYAIYNQKGELIRGKPEERRYLLTYKTVKLKQTREIFLRRDLSWALTEY